MEVEDGRAEGSTTGVCGQAATSLTLDVNGKQFSTVESEQFAGSCVVD